MCFFFFSSRRRHTRLTCDWSSDVCSSDLRAVYDFVRALTRPYPGAFSSLDGRRWTVWHAARIPTADGTGHSGGTPGAVLGPVVSPLEAACGQLVACGEGAVVLLELEADDGTVVRGRTLSEQPWTGKRWSNGDEATS